MSTLLLTKPIPARVANLLERAAASHKPAEKILARANDMGVLPTFLRHFGHRKPWSEMLQLKSAAILGRLALNSASIKRVCELIDTPYILLKGVPLGERIYGSALNRETKDIDLWLRPQDIDSAVAALAAIGYTSPIEPHAWASNQRVLLHPVLAPVELHWALVPSPLLAPSFDVAYRRAVDYEMQNGFTVKVLDDEILWMHLLLHAHQHLFALKPILDLAAACDHFESGPLLHEYGLEGLDHFWRSLIAVWTKLPVSHGLVNPCMGAFLALLARHYLDGLMDKPQWGDLVFGESSEMLAAFGVLARAFSMLIFDGWGYRTKAVATCLFYGPHRIGSLVNDVIAFKNAALQSCKHKT